MECDLVDASAGAGFMEITFLFRVTREVIADSQQFLPAFGR